MLPEDHYRRRLLAAVATIAPDRVLEPGCGRGAFVRAAAARGITVEGIDPDPANVAGLRADGFAARVGRAEQLDLPDASVDAVVFSFTAHHIADWRRAFLEALRVARRAVLVLEPWFDPRMPSQVVAADFDRWCKRIDRATGMVHNDCLDAAALLAPLAGRLHEFQVRVEYLLVLRELGAGELAAIARGQLPLAPTTGPWQADLDRIARRAETDGFSDEGAVLLAVGKP